MKLRLSVLLLLTGLFVATAASPVQACGSTDEGHAALYHHGHEHAPEAHEHVREPAPDPCAVHVAACSHGPSDQPCSDKESDHCHCPGCGIAHHAPVAFAAADSLGCPPFSEGFSLRRQAFYFSEHLPEKVYLPIWQPPQWRGCGMEGLWL